MNEITNARTCFDMDCESDVKYLASTLNGKQIPVCYIHSLQFPPAKVSKIENHE